MQEQRTLLFLHLLTHITHLVCTAELRSRHVEEAHRQVEQALQTADQQIEALKARVSRKNAQLCETKLRLEYLREDVQDGGASQRHAPASLPDTESSEHTGGSSSSSNDLWFMLLCLWYGFNFAGDFSGG